MFQTAVQLYSFREQCAKDFVDMLKLVAIIGFKGVEPAGFYDLTPKEFKKIVNDLGMEVCSAHGPWLRSVEMIPEAAEAPAVKSRREIFIAKAKPYLYLAAMFCGLFFGIKVIQYNASRVEKPVEVSTAQVTQEDYVDQYIDDVCDFAGIGSEQIYACVTDADTNY